jgi:hypothetical protein
LTWFLQPAFFARHNSLSPSSTGANLVLIAPIRGGANPVAFTFASIKQKQCALDDPSNLHTRMAQASGLFYAEMIRIIKSNGKSGRPKIMTLWDYYT